MEDDARQCLQLYEKRGGAVQWDKFEDSFRESRRNDSPHQTCKELFSAAPAELAEQVTVADRCIFKAFGYETCCGAIKKGS